MPKKIDDELKARAVRLVNDHQGEYSSLTAAAAVVAKQLGVGKESSRRCRAPRRRPGHRTRFEQRRHVLRVSRPGRSARRSGNPAHAGPDRSTRPRSPGFSWCR